MICNKPGVRSVLSILTICGSAFNAVAQEVVVGYPLSLTGAYAFAGVPMKRGADIALEEIAASKVLGPVRIKAMFEDVAGEKAQAITMVQRLAVRDKAVVLIGPESILSIAAAPVAQENKIPMLGVTASPNLRKTGDYVFPMLTPFEVTMGALSRYAMERTKVNSAVLISSRDSETLVGIKNVLRDNFIRGNVRVSEETVLSTESDFSVLATKVVGRNPDAIFVSTTPELGANLILQLRRAGLRNDVKVLGVSTFASQQFHDIGGKAVEGTIYPAEYFVGGSSAQNQAFVAAFRKRFNEAPDNWAAMGYAMTHVVANAIKASGSRLTREGVRDAIGRTKDLPTILGAGRLTYDPEARVLYGINVVAVKGGRAELIEALQP